MKETKRGCLLPAALNYIRQQVIVLDRTSLNRTDFRLGSSCNNNKSLLNAYNTKEYKVKNEQINKHTNKDSDK